MNFIKPTLNLRIKDFNLFKWTKQGIILTYGSGFNKHIINLNDNLLIDKDGTLDFLYELLDLELPKQQIDDIKEVISELLENS